MRLSLHTDYALRTLLFLADRPGRSSVAQIAQFFQISRDHVAKVVQSLVRLGYVRSVRGIGGGVELKRRPAEIRIGELIVAFEGNMNLLECVSTEGLCVIQPTCRLRTVLATAERLQLDYLNSVCLADLLVSGQMLARIESSPEPAASG